MKDPFAHSVKQVERELNSDLDRGLNASDAKKRLLLHGENKLEDQVRKKTWLIFLQQFLDPIIYILTGAMVLAFVFSEVLEGFAILAVLLITALIGFVMELQAIRSVEALQKITKKVSTVIREGKQRQIRTKLLVPGDIIVLAPGDIVPADSRLTWTQSLTVDESVLTGESIEVLKEEYVLGKGIPETDQINMVFKGSTVVNGNGKAIVTGTGMQTVIGHISKLTQEAHHMRSPLEKKLSKLSHRLILLTLILIVVIAVSALFQGNDMLLMAKIGVALAVAAIPEGLPIVATIALARGMIRLSRQKVVIKHLEAVQTLGETTVVCTDKTGTLTENKMSVQTLLLSDEMIALKPDFSGNFDDEPALCLKRFNEVAVLCNNLQPGVDELKGDSVEIALLEFAKDQGIDILALREGCPELDEIPFDPKTKIMLTANKYDSEVLVCVKGALETVLERCTSIMSLNGIQPFVTKDKWIDKSNELASEGLRIMGFAYQECPEFNSWDEIENNYVFIGMVGFMDAPRKDVKAAIQTYKEAGVRVVMITGDHPNTARKIAEEIGLIGQDESPSAVVHGQALLTGNGIQPEDESQILEARVFARMIPEQKLDLVNFYQRHNQVVGMIGDGINDAPALKKADIGIAMGIRGSDAAKEVSDVILLDDKFTSTELAIRQGRCIFQNIRHFVVYLLSCNLAEIISVAVATLSSLPIPLLPLQILFLNLVTDVFPALALGLGKGEPAIMKEAPKDPREPIVTRKLWQSIVVYGLCITVTVLGITAYGYYIKNFSASVVNNMAFYTLILGQLFNVFNLPGRKVSFFKNEVVRNGYVWAAIILSTLIMVFAYFSPLLKRVLSLIELNGEQFQLVFLFGFGSLILTQIVKRLFKMAI
ncbi:MAG: cation-transporting P-type ATPase [Bacteroidia bacterium]|nr:cation-transporting P-type ATPase [Bacteroidia bacterium]